LPCDGGEYGEKCEEEEEAAVQCQWKLGVEGEEEEAVVTVVTTKETADDQGKAYEDDEQPKQQMDGKNGDEDKENGDNDAQ
jgi:hypothetical protein